MPINLRECYTPVDDLERCDGVSFSALSLVGIVGPPCAGELVRRKALLERLGRKSGHDHTPMAQDGNSTKEPTSEFAPRKPEPPKHTEIPQKPEPPEQKLGLPAQNSQLRTQNPKLPLPRLELEIQGNTNGIQTEPPPEQREQSGLDEPGPRQPPKPGLGKLPPVGRLPRGFEQFELPPNPGPPETSQDQQVNALVELLPDHPLRAVSRGLLKGLVSGAFDQAEINSAMQEFARTIKNQDITNLPPVSSDDFPLGDASEMSLRLRKASFAFNDALKKYGLKMEVIDGRVIVIHNRSNYQPVNIGVRLSGEIIAFQGKLERRDFKPMPLQNAVAELKPLLAPP